MKNISAKQISDIAQKLNSGCHCFVHRKTMAIIAIPDFADLSEEKIESFEVSIEKIENNPDKYLSIEMPEGRDLFYIMENFTNSLDANDAVKAKLQIALKNRKPANAFMAAIKKEKKHTSQWEIFVQKGMTNYVKECIENDEFAED
jgi:Uncharacterised protein family (UPF0158)